MLQIHPIKINKFQFDIIGTVSKTSHDLQQRQKGPEQTIPN